MISTKGVCIGNYLEHKFSGKIVQVDGVTKELIYSEAIAPVAIHMSAYSAIPLTPEILEKCGFINKRYIGDISLELKTESEYGEIAMRFENEKIEVLFPDDSFYSFRPPCTSLHQLQNLYFALTGEELQYKP